MGYGGTPADEYIQELKKTAEIREQRDELLAKAEDASGVEKAKLLDEALNLVGELALVAYPDVADQIVQLDAENQAGLKEKYEGKVRGQQIEEALTKLRREYATVGVEGTLAKIDEMITQLNPKGETLQQVLFLKAQLLYGTDKEKSKATLEAAQKLAPESRVGRQIDAVLKQAFRDPPSQDEESDKDDSDNDQESGQVAPRYRANERAALTAGRPCFVVLRFAAAGNPSAGNCRTLRDRQDS